MMIDTTKPAAQMTDDELADVLKLAAMIDDAKAEQKRRADAAAGIRTVSLCQPCVHKKSHAPCPKCGRDDAFVASKTLYDSPYLAYDGKIVGTACYCGGSCRTWYNAEDGSYIDWHKVYSY